MVNITREEVLKLAKTADLTFTEEELTDLVKRLESVIDYASYLREIAEQAEGSATLPKLSNVTREDVVKPVPVEPLLELAPEREEDYYVVPVILKQ